MLDLLAIFIAPIIVVVFARVANDMHHCLVVAHKVVGNIHEDTDTLWRVILNRGIIQIIWVAPVDRFIIVIDNFLVIIINWNVREILSTIESAPLVQNLVSLFLGCFEVNKLLCSLAQVRQHIIDTEAMPVLGHGHSKRSRKQDRNQQGSRLLYRHTL